MKTVFKFLIFTFVVSLTAHTANGQRFLKTLQNKVEQKVNERIDNKVDETLDKKLDEIEDSLEKDAEPGSEANSRQEGRSSEQRVQNLLKGLGVSGEPVSVADSYSFNQLIEMHVESFDKKGKKESEGDFITYLSSDSKSLAYQVVSGDMGNPGQGMFIIDSENGAAIVLNNEKGEKTGIVYGMGALFSSMGKSIEKEDIPETQEAYLANPNVKKTGRTKTIAGYKCEEYKYDDEGSSSEIWITRDVKMNTQDFFSNLFKVNLYSQGMPWGYMMEATTTDKKSGEIASVDCSLDQCVFIYCEVDAFLTEICSHLVGLGYSESQIINNYYGTGLFKLVLDLVDDDLFCCFCFYRHYFSFPAISLRLILSCRYKYPASFRQRGSNL